jgi:hypothetical protein
MHIILTVSCHIHQSLFFGISKCLLIHVSEVKYAILIFNMLGALNMTLLIRSLFLLVISFSSMQLHALPENLSEYTFHNPTWENDSSSKSFITTRCSVVNLIASERLSQDKRTGSENLSESFKSFSTTFALYSEILYKLGGGSIKSFQDRALHWTTLYSQDAIDNINNFNQMTRGDFGEDLKFCNQTVLDFILKDIETLPE